MKNLIAQIQEQEQRLAAETGPRGGKIIGKTQTGKPIYESKAPHEYHDQLKAFTPEDHNDASKAHFSESRKHSGPKKQHHRDMGDKHISYHAAMPAKDHPDTYPPILPKANGSY